MEENIETLLKSAQEGETEALKAVIKYYENDGDEEMASYFKEKLSKAPTQKTDEAKGTAEPAKSSEPETIDKDSKTEQANISYDELSTAELKQKVDNDPKACEALGRRYLMNSQTEKAMELFNSAIDMLKDNYEDCTQSDLTTLFNCYYSLGIAYGNKEEAFLNLQNAVEVPITEKVKEFAYFELAKKYKEKGDKTAYDKYLSKAGACSKYSCLKVAIRYQIDENKVDYEDWLERARKMESPTNFGNAQDLAEHLDSIIDFKIKCEKDTVCQDDCIKFIKDRGFNYAKTFQLLTILELNYVCEGISSACFNYKEKTVTNVGLDLYNACQYLMNDAKNTPDNYKNIDLTKIEEFYLKFLLDNLKSDNINFYVDDRLYNMVRPTIMGNKDVKALKAIMKCKGVKDNPELNEKVAADLQKAISEEKKTITVKKIATWVIGIYLILAIGAALERKFGTLGDIIIGLIILAIARYLIKQKKEKNQN